jgi:hypothetical protein
MRQPVSSFVNVISPPLDPGGGQLGAALVFLARRSGTALRAGRPLIGIATLRVAQLGRLRTTCGGFLSEAGT